MNCKKKCNNLSKEDCLEIRIMTIKFMEEIRQKFPGNVPTVDGIILRVVVESSNDEPEVQKLTVL